jgi:hypothetical protein
MHPSALRRHRLDAGGDGAAKSNLFEKPAGRIVNAGKVGVFQRLILSTHHARAHSSLIHGNGARPEGPPGITSATSLRKIFNPTHDMPFDMLFPAEYAFAAKAVRPLLASPLVSKIHPGSPISGHLPPNTLKTSLLLRGVPHPW